MIDVQVIHGPNLNWLGVRERGFYGKMTLDALNDCIREHAGVLGLSVEMHQTDREECLVDWVRSAARTCRGLIINPAGLGYTSISLRDAAIICGVPMIEVHLSNIHGREAFRHRTVIADICTGQISGFKENSYILALEAMKRLLTP